MGKGKSKARRQKNAAAAAAQKNSATGVLPETNRSGANKRNKKRKGGGQQAAPEYDGMPRKMRELMRLKEFAERSNEESKRSRDHDGDDDEDVDNHQEHHQGGAGDADSDGDEAAGDQGGSAEKEGGAAAAADGGKRERDGEQKANKKQGSDADADADSAPKQQKPSREPAPISAGAARKPKASKLKAKEWKKQKKLKQQMKSIGPVGEGMSDSDDDATETKPADKVRFGEQAQKPPEFSLKQKTWTSEQQSRRCTAIFERQMEEAKNAARQQTSVPNVGMMNAQDATLRLRLIDGYRSARKQQAVASSKNKSDRGPATLQSLKALVKAAATSNNGDKGH